MKTCILCNKDISKGVLPVYQEMVEVGSERDIFLRSRLNYSKKQVNNIKVGNYVIGYASEQDKCLSCNKKQNKKKIDEFLQTIN